MRILIIGCSGAGKTTLAGRIGNKLQIPHLELDSVFHQANWQPLARDEFRARVTEYMSKPSWVIDGNYFGQLGDLVWGFADVVVWVDPSRARVMSQIISRTLRRGIKREILWNGNREHLSLLLNPNPEENLVLWAWTRFSSYRVRHARLASEAGRPKVIRLCHRKEVEDFVQGLGRAGSVCNVESVRASGGAGV